ncbi:MAG: hypothetical protein K2G37_03390 [Clostridia bacterium]|nr:hypothetical protein [Clostridia bacterium]MDE7328215.1 hypothetical protein [Clostridia bacterium]
MDSNEPLPPTKNENGNPTEVLPEQPAENEGSTIPPDTELPEQAKITKMYITINGNKLEITLAENSSVDALVEKLKQGDITYTASDYGGFEKVGSLGFGLPTNNTQITTQAGDVVLYSGNQIVLFYGSNSWSYTRLGKINGYSVSELKTLLGAGSNNVQVTISLS